MNLSPNFTLDEFTASQTAARLGIDNTPPSAVMTALHATAEGMEKVRTCLGNVHIYVSSGYRSDALNTAVHGQPNGQHPKGEACDFTAPAFGSPAQIIDALIASDVPYDQVILEFGRWVHISFSARNRRQALVIDSTGTRAYA